MEISFTPEISARRVSGLMQYFIQERSIEEENPFSEFLERDAFFALMQDSNIWISQGLEEKLINYLSSMEDISPALYQIGKETFLAQAYDLLPTNDVSLNILEFINRMPVLLSRLTRTIRLDVVLLEDTSASFSFEYLGKTKEKWYDVIFFKGMLDGLSMLFELSDFTTILEETKLLGIHVHHRDLGDNIKFGGDRNIYKISWTKASTQVARTKLNNELRKSQKTFVISRNQNTSEEELSVLNLSSVIDKSRELALENRDLEAAVEVLKSFKNELEVKQKSIAKDLKLASDIQRGIIPQTIPDWKGLQFWNSFLPMQEVSGDYYDYFTTDDSMIGIALCDVSGHGVPAAFITALSKMLFSVYRSSSPSSIFKKVNRDLLELLQYQGYTTCIYAVIDENYSMTYSVAGHPKPILVRKETSQAQILEGEGTFLGMFPEANDYYEDYKVQLSPGDKIFLYTDGVTEAESDDGSRFGESRLLDAINQTKDLPIRESIESIMKVLNEFTMGTDQGDDITVLGFELSSEISRFQSLYKQGNAFFKKKDYSSAIGYYESAMKIMPREMNNTLALAKTLAMNQEYQKSIGFLQEYNQFKIHDYKSHFILGFCYYKINDYDNAESEFKKALYMEDSQPHVYYNLAKVYRKIGEVGKMEEIIMKINKLFPNFSKNFKLNQLLSGDI